MDRGCLLRTRISIGGIVAALVFTAGAFALDPAALPTGGQITSGQGTLSQTGGALTVRQQSDKLIANWNTFNIGQSASVTFQQPGPGSVALNRILDQSPSQIYGSLSANGQVFLVNPAGIYFGPTARVDVGGLVASSLNISNENFLAGRYLFENTGTAGEIRNQGTIRAAAGGYLAFLSPKITNEGVVAVTGGTAAMAAGDRVSLDFTGDGLVNFTVEQGTVDALIQNKGLIQADGGAVLLTAKAADQLTSAVVNNAGVIEAKTLANQAGRIFLLSAGEVGETIVAGRLDASAPDGGDGGFIETSAAKVTVKDGFQVTTKAAGGQAGTWLIDPRDFTIAASGGDMTGAQVTAALAGGNVEIQSASGGTGANGDIFVNDSITWAASRLTLNAYRHIEINRTLYGSGTAQLALLYGQGAADGVIGGAAATYSVNAPVNLAAGNNFFTQLGSNAANLKTYTVITSLGAAGSTTAADLQGMKGNPAGYYVLGADIDASATSGWNDDGFGGKLGFEPIGTPGSIFTGKFDGLGHTLSGLTISRPEDCIGLFGYARGADLRNMGMVGGSVTGNNDVGLLLGYGESGTAITNSYATGTVTGDSAVGGLVGMILDGTVTRSSATGAVAGRGGIGVGIGGLAGYGYRTAIMDSHAAGTITATQDVGGLVGYNDGGAITNSYATGPVTSARGMFIGGLVGDNIDGTITNSYATGAVEGANWVGGLAGYSTGTITNSHATGATIGSDSVGGLVGVSVSGTITGSYATGAVRGDNCVGGLVGCNGAATIADSYATGTVKGSGDTVGGLVGENVLGTVSNSYATGDVTGGSCVGGLVGCNGAATIVGSHATGTVTGSGDNVGGLVGTNENGTITGSYAINAVTGAGNVGGLVGYNWSDATGAITSSYATGQVTGSGDAVGGLVGWNENAGTDTTQITGSYATGTVKGSGDKVGGLVGYNQNNDTGTLLIANSYATGNVTGTTAGGAFYPVGGLVGYNENDGAGAIRITNSYATGTVTGDYPVGGLVGYNKNTSTGAINITGSYATGAVTGNFDVGGLVGWNDDGGVIERSYATGSVTGVVTSPVDGTTIGGLVGYNSGTVTDSYATGAVTGNSNVGGLVAYNTGAGTITNSYATGKVTASGTDIGGLVGWNGSAVTNSFYDSDTTGQTDAGKGTGKTTVQMKQLGTFSSTWNIDDAGGTGKTWRLYEGYTYPLLRNFLTAATATPEATKTYDGTTTVPLAWTPAVDNSKIFGTVVAVNRNVGTWVFTLSGVLYSNQQGYDITLGLARGVLTILPHPTIEMADAAWVSPANMSNGTATLMGVRSDGVDEGRGGNRATPNAMLMGPGAGSTTLAGLFATDLVAPWRGPADWPPVPPEE